MGWRDGPYQGRAGSNPERCSLPALLLGLRIRQREAILAECELQSPNPTAPATVFQGLLSPAQPRQFFCRRDLTWSHRHRGRAEAKASGYLPRTRSSGLAAPRVKFKPGVLRGDACRGANLAPNAIKHCFSFPKSSSSLRSPYGRVPRRDCFPP